MEEKTLRIIRVRLAVFIAALVFSGITAIPLESEVIWGLTFLQWTGHESILTEWIGKVHAGITTTGRDYPFMAYGTDWLAFGHIAIAMFFIGPFRDPVRNKWVITAGCIACALVLPLAFVMGPVRGIPLFWQLIDCSFGVVGGFLLLSVYRHVSLVEKNRIKRMGYKYF